VSGRTDVGALRLRTIATKDHPAPVSVRSRRDHPTVILIWINWVLSRANALIIRTLRMLFVVQFEDVTPINPSVCQTGAKYARSSGIFSPGTAIAVAAEALRSARTACRRGIWILNAQKAERKLSTRTILFGTACAESVRVTLAKAFWPPAFAGLHARARCNVIHAALR